MAGPKLNLNEAKLDKIFEDVGHSDLLPGLFEAIQGASTGQNQTVKAVLKDAEKDGSEKAAGKENDPEAGGRSVDAILQDIIADLSDGDGKFDVGNVIDLAQQVVSIGKGRKFGKGTKGDDKITIDNDDGATAYGGEGNDTLSGGAGKDKLIGKFGNNDLDGGAGDDEVRGGNGTDRIRGGLGNDRGVGGDGDDLINGDEGDDILRGDLGRDTIFGGADNDRLFGFADEDSVMGGDGDDIVRGGLANDMLYGGAGKDTIRGGEDEDYIEGGDGADKLYGGNGNDSLLGEDGDDRLEGQSGRDTLDGGAGNDNLRGGSEDDVIFGGLGDDFVLAGTGDDVVTGADGVDRIHGEAGDDSITGDTGNDRLFGGNGTDTVFGGAGDDVVNGGTEDDSLSGGAGNDTLGGSSGDDIVSGGDGDDLVNGGTGDDNLFGGAGNDVIDGGSNADSIFGGDGDDSLTGGFGNDVLNGGAGHDLFVSDAGDDTLSGAEGSEWYYYQDEDFGHDLIQDFDAAGGDLLDLSQTGFSRADLNIRQVTEDMVTIDVPGDRSITLAGKSGFDINTAAIYFGENDGAVELRDFITNGSFENVTETGDVLGAFNGNGNGRHDTTEVVWYRTVEGWGSNDGKVEIKGEDASGAHAIRAADGKFYAELDDGRSLFENNELHQDVQGLTTGRSYALNFDFANNAGNSDGFVDVFFGGEKIASITSNSGNFASKSFDVTGGAGDGSDRLSFVTQNTGNEAGAYIDNVKLLGYVDTDGALTPVDTNDNGGGNDADDTLTGGGGGEGDGGEGDGGLEEFIVNGSFENLTETGRVLGAFNGNGNGIHDTTEVVWYESVEGWDSRDGRIEVKGEDASGAFAIDASDGQFYVELDDGSRHAQFENNELNQTVEGLEAGETYTLTFDSANNAGNSHGHIDVFFGGQKIGSVTSNSGTFQENSFDVVGGFGNGSDKLSFVTSNSNNEAGAFIDNVSLKGPAAAGDGGDAGGVAVVPDGEILNGTSGKDTLRGSDRDDLIDGGAKRDKLFGGDGEDTLSGGTGNDIMTGGNDGDTFVFDSLDFGLDRIKDFDAAEGDRLDFSKIADELSDLNIFSSNGDTFIQVGNGGRVELDGVNQNELANEEVFMFG